MTAAPVTDRLKKAKGRSGPGRGKAGAKAGPAFTDAPTLADLGITKKVAAVAQQMAALPPATREDPTPPARPRLMSPAKRTAMEELDDWTLEHHLALEKLTLVQMFLEHEFADRGNDEAGRSQGGAIAVLESTISELDALCTYVDRVDRDRAKDLDLMPRDGSFARGAR